ncbi:MAG: hypothetical protein HC834_03500 [Rhodospirillales bacterium]|nr:hypothetical protein [Rhodospirillales bacterium]
MTNSGTVTGLVTNSGTATNTGSFGGGLVNDAGTTSNSGTISNGVTVNGGTFTTTGTVLGGLTNAATTNAAGTVNGPVANSGTFTVTGALVGDGSVTNAAGGVLGIGGNSYTGATTVTNDGQITIGTGTLGAASVVNNAAVTIAGGTLQSNVTNSGSISGPGTVTGSLANTGSVSVQNGATGNTFAVQGNYSGGGSLSVDVNTANGTSDKLVVGGTASGTTAVNFNVLGNGFVLALPVVQTGGAAGGTQFSGSVADFGNISYAFVQQGNDWVLKSSLNSSFGPIASIGGALASVTSSFQQPASSYVGDRSGTKPNDILCGTWARGDSGRLDTTTSSAVSSGGQAVGASSIDQKIEYSGFQGGLDCGLLRVGGTNWNIHLGVTGGLIDGFVQQAGVGKVDVEVPFYGAYAFFRNGGFVFDVSLRQEHTKAEFDIAQAGLDGREVDGTSTSVAVYTSYAMALGKTNFTFTPYAGASWSHSELDAFDTFAGVNGARVGRVSRTTPRRATGGSEFS